jgi:hypothetical protein
VNEKKHNAMQFSLFPLPAVDSPRLKWIKRYAVEIQFCPYCEPGDLFPWIVTSVLHTYPGEGNTEQEALRDFALNNGLKLWNEL